MVNYLDVLPCNSTAVAVKTKGHNLSVNFGGISSTGCWVVDKDRVDDFVIIFHETVDGNKIYIGEYLEKNPEEYTERKGKKYPRYRIFLSNIKYMGLTKSSWTEFTGKKSSGYERIYLTNNSTTKTIFLDPSSREAYEGYKKDSRILITVRDIKLAERRKRLDNYTCQSCGFKIQLNGKYIVDCHHIEPVSLGKRKTKIEDLISLCPTCHRIAHTKVPPYSPTEVKAILKHT